MNLDGRLGLQALQKHTRESPVQRHAIDSLFESAAAVFGDRTIGIVLSGLDGDGTAGLTAIEEVDGVGIVQDPEEASEPELPVNALRHDQSALRGATGSDADPAGDARPLEPPAPRG